MASNDTICGYIRNTQTANSTCIRTIHALHLQYILQARSLAMIHCMECVHVPHVKSVRIVSLEIAVLYIHTACINPVMCIHGMQNDINCTTCSQAL